MEGSAAPTFDKKSNIWLEPFSVILNCMFPAEYIYGNWFQLISESRAKRSDQDSLVCPSPNELETGSRVEGFCIPEILVAKNDYKVPLGGLVVGELEHWQVDCDSMDQYQPYRENIPEIFTVEHVADDPSYVRLRLTNQWKQHYPQYKDVTFLHQSFHIPSTKLYMLSDELDSCRSVTSELHGPVRKKQATGFLKLEEDNTGVFKYPLPWPEPAMQWLVRSRPGSWPSTELVRDVFESGCHIAPMGRGKRQQEPIDLLDYFKDPTQALSKKHQILTDGSQMDETEWRLSFSVAENKLGQSVSSVQRHVIVVLKMLKKFYFPNVISSYLLKNLLFWEIEKQDESFWREDNSAKCVVHMLDRLEQCLEDGCLPHYIIPESNLLQYEDRQEIAKGTAIVRDVRKSILSKTVNMLKRVFSLTYGTQFYLQDLDWDSLCTKIDDIKLTAKEVEDVVCSLLYLFEGKCKAVIEKLINEIETEELDDCEKNFMYVPMYAYKSLLARCLCKSWSGNFCERSKNDFVLFAQKKVGELASDSEVLELLLMFYDQAQNGKDISALVPYTNVMDKTKEFCAIFGEQLMARKKADCSELCGGLSRSDMKEITEKVFAKHLEGGNRLENLTIENVKSEMMLEIELLKQEKQKNRLGHNQSSLMAILRKLCCY